MAVPGEALEARLTGLPEGVTVEADRIEVRFGGAKEAVGGSTRWPRRSRTTTSGSKRSSAGDMRPAVGER